MVNGSLGQQCESVGMRVTRTKSGERAKRETESEAGRVREGGD